MIIIICTYIYLEISSQFIALESHFNFCSNPGWFNLYKSCTKNVPKSNLNLNLYFLGKDYNPYIHTLHSKPKSKLWFYLTSKAVMNIYKKKDICLLRLLYSKKKIIKPTKAIKTGPNYISTYFLILAKLWVQECSKHVNIKDKSDLKTY